MTTPTPAPTTNHPRKVIGENGYAQELERRVQELETLVFDLRNDLKNLRWDLNL